MSERTEAPTPHRLAKLRADGRVARSQDLSSAVALLAGFALLQSIAPTLAGNLEANLVGAFQGIGQVSAPTLGEVDDLLWAQHVLGGALSTGLLALVPLLAVLPLVGVGVAVVQGLVLSPKTLMSWDRVNPLAGVKRLFSPRSLVEALRAVAKVALVALMASRALQDALDRLPRVMGSTDPRALASFLGESALGVGLAGAEALLILALADYAYQRWSFTRGARMTKQEIKEEHKQQEGDPFLKSQLRARQRQLATVKRQLLDVPQAAVVVTNPTHFAVALKYDVLMPSPVVVAKGADLIAERIKEVARQAGVPIVENKPLARGLYASAEVGQEIPLDLYRAVAEVLAYVFSRKKARAWR